MDDKFEYVLAAGFAAIVIAVTYALGPRASGWLAAGICTLIILGLFVLAIALQAMIFYCTIRHTREKRLGILASDYGRREGWWVEYEGRRLASLTEPRYEDMFWVSYRMEPVTDDAEERARLLNDKDWWLACVFVYRSKTFGEVVPWAFAAGHTFPKPGRVTPTSAVGKKLKEF
jgi:hypothetical protein